MAWKSILVFTIFGASVCSSQSFEAELRESLMQDYNKMALPSQPTQVSVRFTVLHFDMNEAKQSMDLDIWVSMEWKDPHMKWSKRKYPRIRSMAFHPDSVWKPDLFLYNNAEPSNFDPYARTDVLAMNDGVMVWVPPAHIKSMCVIDMTMWPHDLHNCTAKFGSWVHNSMSVNVTVKDDTIMFEEVTMNHQNKDLTRGEWKVLGSSVVREGKIYACCPEEYVNVQVSLLVERNAPAFKWLIQVPSVVLSILTLVVFLLPPSAGEKVIFGGIALVLDFLFLLSMSVVIGHATNNTPLIVKLVSQQLVLTCASVVAAALILRMVRDPHSSGVPRCIKALLVLLSTCCCLSGYRQMVTPKLVTFKRSMKAEDMELNDGGNGQSLFNGSLKNEDNDWLLLAAVIDRVCLIVFIIIFVVNMISYSSIL